MQILIAGGCGFIGSHLCEFILKNTSDSIICIDNMYSGRMCNVAHLISKYNERFKLIVGDIIDYDFSNIHNIDQIYHLACPASPIFYQKSPIFTLKTNTIGTINLLELAKINKAKILITSTSEIYGDPLVDVQSEEYWGNVNCIGPRSCYDEGKRIAETMFMEYRNVYDVDTRICRIFNTYGDNLNPHDGRVVSNFLRQAIANEDITIYGNGEQTRSFMHVDDLIVGVIKLMESNYNYPVNLGNPDEYTINEFANIIIELTNSKSKIVNKDLPTNDPKKRKPDIRLAKTILDWEPMVTFKHGLARMIKKYSTNSEQ